MIGTLIIMAKAPEVGLAKTRLARVIGRGRAASLARAMLASTLAESRGGLWRLEIHVAPRRGLVAWSHLWPRDAALAPQTSGDLGDRLRAALDAAPPGPVTIIGTDAPALRRRHITAAFRALGRADAVVGPAHDGGYWLIGLARRRRAPGLFDGVRWSTEHALVDTLASLPPTFVTARLETLADIDEAEDLRRLTLRSMARQRTAQITLERIQRSSSR